MNATDRIMERRVRRAGILVIAGLGVELASFASSHPTSFLLFLALGVGLTAIGVGVFLLGLARLGVGRVVSANTEEADEGDEAPASR